MNELTPYRICLMILGIFFSWLSVFFYQKRITIHFPLNICLWLFFLLPGIIHCYLLLLFTEPEYGGKDLCAE